MFITLTVKTEEQAYRMTRSGMDLGLPKVWKVGDSYELPVDPKEVFEVSMDQAR